MNTLCDYNQIKTDSLANIYHNYQNTINILPPPSNGSLKSLVTFDDAKGASIHRWYSFKEGYSYKLLDWLKEQDVIKPRRGARLLDPFCGVATTLLAFQTQGDSDDTRVAIGVERNPAIRSIGNAKLRWWQYDPCQVERILEELRSASNRGHSDYPVPNLSTFSKVRNGKRAFHPAALQDILFYKAWIHERCNNIPELGFFLLAWTAIIEQASNTRKDGRALRLSPEDECPHVQQLLVAQCELMLSDICGTRSRPIHRQALALGGDARSLPFADQSFDLICYSPPYLNNIDYTEVYKLELWLRGDVVDQHDFRTLRRGTFRSHPSVIFPSTHIAALLPTTAWINRLKTALLLALPNDKFHRMRHSLIDNYVDDLILTLREQKRVSIPQAPIVCVVGNSLHGGEDGHVLICTDLLIAAAAQAAGLVVDHLQIARQLPRRDHQNGWLRETIIIMHNPS